MRTSVRLLYAFIFLAVGSTPFPLCAQEPEEPDFFFLTGGPYTQQGRSPQIIWAAQQFRAGRGLVDSEEYVGGGRFEWGLTGRWEIDFEFGVLAIEEELDDVTLLDESGAADLLLGVRYRLLDEATAPFTLTLGPQVFLPTASRSRGLGNGKAGYAVDLAAAKDWGGPVFLVSSLNAGYTPGVPSGPLAGDPKFDLASLSWAAALGFRALERKTGSGTSHDIHAFLELEVSREEGIDLGIQTRPTAALFSPGLRYGFLSRGNMLTEFGFAVPLGLNDEAPDWGWILQVQVEWAPLFGSAP